jgi:putative FmdB family regulatory protein
MPIYEYRCENCAKVFSIQLSMSEHEKGNITCPDCKEARIVPQYSAFYAKTSKKS